MSTTLTLSLFNNLNKLNMRKRNLELLFLPTQKLLKSKKKKIFKLLLNQKKKPETTKTSNPSEFNKNK